MENFKLSKVKELSQNDARAYISHYFYPLTNGDHAMRVNEKFEIFDKAVIKDTYFNRMSKELQNYYFKEITDIKTVVYKLNKETFYEDYINLCPKFMHTYKEYKLFSPETKSKVNYMLTFILEIICGNHQESYKFLMTWISNMVKGNKNTSTPVLKGPMGLGKSSLPQFLSKHVIGNDLCLESGSGPLKSNFNSILGGKLFVCFEELENSSVSEWNSMSSVLKKMITSDRIVLEAKNKNPYETNNINNYMILSNNDAIKDDEGRRYFIADLDAKRIGDVEFFKNLYECFNDQVGEAFYCYLLEIDTDHFNPQGYPMTRNKLDSISKRLDSVYQFLKDDYILCNKGIQCSVQVLYDRYLEHSKLKRQYTKIDFNKQMKLINIVHYPSSGVNKYKISKEDLLLIAKKNNWIHELDEFEDGDEEPVDNFDYKGMYLEGIAKIKELQNTINKLNSKI
jgi:hypothetical protein